MNKTFHACKVAACLCFAAIPILASAQTDPKTLTCTEFTPMSDAEMMATVVEMHQVSNDSSANVMTSPAEAVDATKKACIASLKVNAIEALAMKYTSAKKVLPRRKFVRLAPSFSRGEC